MAYCNTCGKQNTDTAKFCTACGGAITTIQQPVQSKNNLKIIIISVISLVVVAVCYFLFFHKKSKSGITSPITADTTTIQQPDPFILKESYAIPQHCNFDLNKEKIKKWTTAREIFPIGWSRNGKFAWLEENNSDVVSDYFFDLFIQDMESDKTVWHWNFTVSLEDNNNEDQKAGFSPEDENDINRRKIWNRYSHLIVQKLNEFQIEPISITSFEKFPFLINNNTCSYSIKNQLVNNPASEISEILATSVYFTVNGIDKKRIYTQKYAIGQSAWDGHLSNQIPGFLKSPFENRIALFLLDEYNAWETYSEWTFTIIGCDLNNVGLY